MLKKLCIVFVLLWLISCWSDDTTPDGATTLSQAEKKWLSVFETDAFSLAIPAAWEILDDIDTLLPKPNNGDIELAANSPDTQYWFANNILILSQDINTSTSSKEFSLLNNIWVEREYSEYVKLDTKDISFANQDTSLLYIFEARYNIDTPKLKFLQTAAVCHSSRAYFLTIALPISLKDISKYEDILQTFSCK